MIDTLSKRLSMLTFGIASLTLPIPDGVLTQGDEQHLLGLYSGTTISESSTAGLTRQILCRSHAGFGTSSDTYLDFLGGANSSGSGSGPGVIWPISGVWRNLLINLETAPGVGKSWTFTVQVNEVDTAIVIVISGTALTGRYVAADLPFTALDRLRLKVLPAGTPTAMGAMDWSIEFEGSTAKQSAYAFSGGNLVGPDAYQSVFSATKNNWQASLHNGQKSVVAAAGSLTGFAVRAASAFAAGIGFNFYLVKNEIEQDGTGGTVDTLCALIGVQLASATYDVPVLPGDVVYWHAVQVGGVGAAITSGCVFTATTAGESQFANTPDSALNSASTTYMKPSGSVTGSWGTTEDFVRNFFGGVTPFGLKTLHVLLQTAPGAGNSHTFTARLNFDDALGGQVVTLSGAAQTVGSDLIGQYNVADRDRFSLKDVPISGPSGGIASWTYIQTVVVAAAVPPGTNPPQGGEPPQGDNPDPGDPVGDVHFAQIVLKDGTEIFSAETLLRDPSTVYGGKKPAKLLKISKVKRELSPEGYRASEFSIEVDDTPDRITGQMFWRGLSATATMEGAYIAVYRCTAPHALIVGIPFRIAAGVVFEGGHEPLEGFRYRFAVRDVLGDLFGDPQNQPLIPADPITAAEFGTLDPAFDGKVAPRVLGRVGESGVGAVPTIYLGGPANLSVAPFSGPNVEVDVHLIAQGAVSAITEGYFNLMVWGPLQAIEIGDVIRPGPLNANGYNFRATAGGLTGTTEPTWPTTGTVGDGAVTWTVHAVDDPRARFPIPMEAYTGNIATHPFAPNWTTAAGLLDTWVDYNGRRFTPFLILRSHRYAQALREGRVTLMFDVVGAMDGPSGGAVIESFEYLYIHLLINYGAFGFHTDGIVYGPMPMLPGIDGPYSAIDTDSADASKAVGDALGGLIGGFILGPHGEQERLWDVLSRILRGGWLRIGPNRHGQLMFARKDPAAVAVIQFNEQRDHVTFQAFIAKDRRGTRVNYRYGFRYASPFAPDATPREGSPLVRSLRGNPAMYGEWASGLQTLISAPAESALDKEKPIDLDNYVTRDGNTALQVATGMLADAIGPSPAYDGTRMFRITGPWDLLTRLDSNGKTRELGDVIGITDSEGMTATGWAMKRGWITLMEKDPEADLILLEGEILE